MWQTYKGIQRKSDFSTYFTINPCFVEVVISYGLLMQKLFNISIVNLNIKVASVAR